MGSRALSVAIRHSGESLPSRKRSESHAIERASPGGKHARRTVGLRELPERNTAGETLCAGVRRFIERRSARAHRRNGIAFRFHARRIAVRRQQRLKSFVARAVESPPRSMRIMDRARRKHLGTRKEKARQRNVG